MTAEHPRHYDRTFQAEVETAVPEIMQQFRTALLTKPEFIHVAADSWFDKNPDIFGTRNGVVFKVGGDEWRIRSTASGVYYQGTGRYIDTKWLDITVSSGESWEELRLKRNLTEKELKELIEASNGLREWDKTALERLRIPHPKVMSADIRFLDSTGVNEWNNLEAISRANQMLSRLTNTSAQQTALMA